MNLLLDTHTFLWFIEGNSKLSSQAKRLIEDQENNKLISIASLWEIGIKISLGRLSLLQPFEDFFTKQMELNGFLLLPIQTAHIARVVSLPFHHRDPFDRIIIAQCLAENWPVVSVDSAFDTYPIERLW